MNCVASGLLWAVALASAPVAAQAQQARAERTDAATAAQAAGAFGEARQILRSLLRESPDDPDILRRLAMVDAADGDLDTAMERIELATRLAPDDLDIALARAYILFWRGNTDQSWVVLDQIEARQPNYPELAGLRAALDRDAQDDGIRLRALSVGLGFSDIKLRSGVTRTWNSQNFVGAIDVSRSDTVILSANREDRGSVDTRMGARVDHRLRNGYFYVAGTAVLEPNFQERWSLSGGGERVVARGVTGLIDLRVAEYDTDTIVAVQPGIRIALAPDFSATGRAINILGGGEDHRLGASLRLDYASELGPSLFAIAVNYPDAEAEDVRDLRSLAAGFTIPVTNLLSLTAAGIYEDRDDSYRRWSGTLALSYRFASR